MAVAADGSWRHSHVVRPLHERVSQQQPPAGQGVEKVYDYNDETRTVNAVDNTPGKKFLQLHLMLLLLLLLCWRWGWEGRRVWTASLWYSQPMTISKIGICVYIGHKDISLFSCQPEFIQRDIFFFRNRLKESIYIHVFSKFGYFLDMFQLPFWTTPQPVPRPTTRSRQRLKSDSRTRRIAMAAEGGEREWPQPGMLPHNARGIRQTDGDTDRRRHWQTETQIDGDSDRGRHKQTETVTDGDTDRRRHRQTDSDRQRQWQTETQTDVDSDRRRHKQT